MEVSKVACTCTINILAGSHCTFLLARLSICGTRAYMSYLFVCEFLYLFAVLEDLCPAHGHLLAGVRHHVMVPTETRTLDLGLQNDINPVGCASRNCFKFSTEPNDLAIYWGSYSLTFLSPFPFENRIRPKLMF